MPAGQQIALQPALALMLAEDFHHPAVGVQVVVVGERLGVPDAVGRLRSTSCQRLELNLVRAEEAEVLGCPDSASSHRAGTCP